MKTNLLFLILLISIASFSQECPCVKTAIIGTDAKASIIHNNTVVAMDNITINLGENINLYAKKSTGKTTWYKGGEILYNTLISPTETTEFTVKSTLNGCPDAISKVQIQVKKSSLDEQINEVSIFSNPTNDFVTISSNNKIINSIHISNLLGNNLVSYQYKGNLTQQTLNISNLSSGIYIINIGVGENYTITKRIIKN